MMHARVLGLALVGLTSVTLSQRASAQGNLTPPGAPSPSQKTLQQIEPRVDLLAAIPGPGVSSDANNHIIISLAGSYYLSGNLVQTKNTGINVTAAGVTVDLNGFQITASSSSAKIGIAIQPAADNCVIKNGSINGTGLAMTNGVLCLTDISNPPKPANGTFSHLAVSGAGDGLAGGNAWIFESCSAKGGTGNGFLTANLCSATVSDCVASQNTGYGFSFLGSTNFLNCQSINNTGIGFYVFGPAIFSNCTASGNQQRGIQVGSGSALTNCSCSVNGAGGISLGSGTLSNCVAFNNSGIGFDLGFGVALTGCTSTANSSHGFLIQYSGSLTGCTAYNNGNGSQSGAVGIYCGSGSLQNCTASQNTGNGILMSTNSSVIGCLAQGNGLSGAGAGINVGDGSTVRDCDASYNQADGIVGTQQCQIVGNLALGNCIGGAAGVAGIRVTGGENRIEANNAVRNSVGANTAIGFSATLTGTPRNLIIRNTARNNDLNYVIAAGNRVAQIIVPSASVNPINGANGSGGSNGEGFASTDPNVNYTY